MSNTNWKIIPFQKGQNSRLETIEVMIYEVHITE